jgi:hypothetical protein
MKRFLIIYLIFNLQPAFSQPASAQDYYDFLLQEEIKIGMQLTNLALMLNSYNAPAMHEQLSLLKKQIILSMEQVEKTDPYHKSKYLKDAFIDYTEKLLHLCKDDFKILIDILSKEQLTESDKDEVLKLNSKIKKHTADVYESLNAAREKYTNKNNIKVQSDPFRFYLEQTKY